MRFSIDTIVLTTLHDACSPRQEAVLVTFGVLE